jgi:hypothetical protein
MCRPILWPGMTDQQVAKLAKITVLVITVAALCSAIYSSQLSLRFYWWDVEAWRSFFPVWC